MLVPDRTIEVIKLPDPPIPAGDTAAAHPRRRTLYQNLTPITVAGPAGH